MNDDEESASREPLLAVVGAGTMGLAIAQLFSGVGYAVRVFDAHGVDLPEMSTAIACTDLAGCVVGADAIFEAIYEDLPAKKSLLREIQSFAGPVPVASNTSTFRPSQLAEGLDFPESVLVAHFFNPAHTVPLVEVVPSPVTAPSALALVRELLRHASKVVVTLDHEVDGFIANRLQAALVREALWLLRNGVASAEEIDAAVVHGIGPRWALAGPFEIMDLGGLDVWQAVTGRLFPMLSIEASTPSEITARVARSDLGRKSGLGFYEHGDNSPSPFARLEAVLDAATPSDPAAAQPT